MVYLWDPTYFWSWFWIIFFIIPVMILWFGVLINIISRRDLSGWAKVGWILLIFILPILGALIYILFIPPEKGSHPDTY